MIDALQDLGVSGKATPKGIPCIVGSKEGEILVVFVDAAPATFGTTQGPLA